MAPSAARGCGMVSGTGTTKFGDEISLVLNELAKMPEHVQTVLDRAEALVRAARGEHQAAEGQLTSVQDRLGKLGYGLEEARAAFALAQLLLPSPALAAQSARPSNAEIWSATPRWSSRVLPSPIPAFISRESDGSTSTGGITPRRCSSRRCGGTGWRPATRSSSMRASFCDPAFIAAAERICRARIDVLSGPREAELSALGVPFLLTSVAIDRFFTAAARIRKHYRTIEMISGG